MGWLIALGILTALAVLPLGVDLRYDEKGPLARVTLGPAGFTVYPWPKKAKKPEQVPPPQSTPAAEPAPAAPAQPASQPAAPQKGGSWKDFLPLVQLGLDFLGAFRRKLRVKELHLKLTLAGDDPCDLAVNYGRAWVAVGNLMPQLERLFVIKKRDVEVQCDFEASQTRVIARLELTITLGRLLALAAVYGFRALREFLQLRKKRRCLQ